MPLSARPAVPAFSEFLSAAPLSVGDLLAGPARLVVPSYQRPYCWTETEASRLLDGVIDAFEEMAAAGGADFYFLGTVLLLEDTGKRNAAPAQAAPLLEVVDGQQRLVTLSILLAVLRDIGLSDDARSHHDFVTLIGGGTAADGERLGLRGTDKAFFAAYVQRPGACHDMPEEGPENAAQENILAVRELFISALMDRDAAWRDHLTEFVLTRCGIVRIMSERIDHAHRIFTVLNDTGKPLGRNDILKAELLGSVPAAAHDRCLAAWDDAEIRLGHSFDGLFSHIRTLHRRTGGQVIEAIRRIVTDCGGWESFLDDEFSPLAGALVEITRPRHDGAGQSAEINALLGYLGWLPAEDWVPPLLTWWRRHQGDPAQLLNFLRPYDRLVYGLRLLGLGSDKRAVRFAAVSTAIRDGADVFAAKGPLAISSEEERNILHNLRSLHTRSPLTCKLLLLRLNDMLAGRPGALTAGDVTVEHVLPQRLAAQSPWRASFPDADVRSRCTASLGNLMLLDQAANERARNFEFARKKTIYLAGTDLERNRLVAELSDLEQWTASEVEARETLRFSQIEALWQFGRGAARSSASSTGRAPRKRT